MSGNGWKVAPQKNPYKRYIDYYQLIPVTTNENQVITGIKYYKAYVTFELVVLRGRNEHEPYYFYACFQVLSEPVLMGYLHHCLEQKKC